MENVDWDVISDGVNYYKKLGYTYVETPWITPNDIIMITCPAHINVFTVDNHGGLVGSAEQGFLDMVSRSQLLEDTHYISAGPCFRNEELDELHQHQFFKVELFYHTRDQDLAASQARKMLQQAYGFINHRATGHVQIVDAGFGWDINVNGIEVGSYGYRFHERIGFWAYGTGVAEPRSTQAQNR